MNTEYCLKKSSNHTFENHKCNKSAPRKLKQKINKSKGSCIAENTRANHKIKLFFFMKF